MIDFSTVKVEVKIILVRMLVILRENRIRVKIKVLENSLQKID